MNFLIRSNINLNKYSSTWISSKICSQSLRGPVSHDPWFPKVQSWCESWSHGDVLMPCPVLRRRFSEGMHLDVNSTSLMVVNDDYTWTWIALVCYWIKVQSCLLARIHDVFFSFFSRNWWVDMHVLWWFGSICSYSPWPLQSISQVIMTTDDRSKERHGKLRDNAPRCIKVFCSKILLETAKF